MPPDDESDTGTGETLAEELGVEDLNEIVFGGRGRLFSAAGKDSPIAEVTEDGLVLRPSQKPFAEEEGSSEEIILHVDEQGILLDELGVQRRIVGAKFKGHSIYWLGDTKPGTTKHYAAWFDNSGGVHRMFVQDEPLTADMVYRIRNRTHDGEISVFKEIVSDKPGSAPDKT